MTQTQTVRELQVSPIADSVDLPIESPLVPAPVARFLRSVLQRLLPWAVPVGLIVLWQIASSNPWLSVTPVSEYSTDPPWATDYPDPQPPRGLHVRQTGRLPDVVTRYGNWGDRQILICGGPGMVEATKAALIARGAPPERIQHDPLTD